MSSVKYIRDNCNENKTPDQLEFTNPILTPAALPTGSAGMLAIDSGDSNKLKYCTTPSTWIDVAAAGTASHAMLSATHSDSTAAAVARGALITGQGSSAKWTLLAKGTVGQFLKSDGTDLAWATFAAGDIPLTTGSMIIGAASIGAALDIKGDGKIVIGNGTTAASQSVSGVITLSNAGVTAFAGGAIVNADVNATAGITAGKLALATGSVMLGASGVGSALDAKADGKIMVGNGTTVTSVSVTGDVSLLNTGATTVVDLTISSEAAGDILYFNGSNWIRLAKPGSSGYFLEGGTTPAWSLPSLGAASSIVTGATLNDAGANDATITFTQQGTAGASVVIPNFAGATANTFAFINFAQTWSAIQTVQYGLLKLGDSDNGQTLQILVNENMTGDKTLTYQPNDADRVIHLHGNIDLGGTLTTLGAWTQTGAHTIGVTTTGATTITLPTAGTLATLAGSETLATKTLTTPKIVTTDFIADGGGDELLVFVESANPVNYIEVQNADTLNMAVVRGNGSDANIGLKIFAKGTGKVTICDSATPTKMMNFELVGATATKTMKILSSHTDDRVLTLPDATDTLVGKATTDTLTNKSLDCDGTGNALTNVNMTELDPIGDAACGIPFIYQKTVADIAAAGTNIVATHPKMKVIDCWFVASSAGTGTVALNKGQVGTVGNNIVPAYTIPADAEQVTRCDEIVQAEWEVAANAGLVAIGDAGASVDGTIFVMCIRVD